MESLASSSTVQLQSPPSGLSINTTPKPRNSVTFKHRSKQVWCTSSSTMKTSATDPSTKKAKEAKLWGGRFEEGVTDAVERFTESISFDKALYKQDIMGSRAHASMLAHQGLISVSDRDSILQGLDNIERRIEDGEFVWRTDREDVHMNIEAALTDLIGEPAKKLHTARSRNDQVLTDFRLWCRDAIDNIVARVKHLQVL
ncbi:Argininosuccinate lyase, chloroplastic [Vitis vinifera]|uniref:Argininosuccinate lyase, chloroplastic n=1 Tax=Vitis vinifera TaxID=29760 RepID=A0A438G017_VITVI|nr:Argininosuccinate lyase, chloroplastic [Vitis vinifera]